MAHDSTDSGSKVGILRAIVPMAILVLGSTLLSLSYFTAIAADGDSYEGYEFCIVCHSEKVEEWKETPHAKAYSDPIFQEEWEKRGFLIECLECHTTGYDSDTGDFAVEGVQCEYCHGPGMTMDVDDTAELCGQCHTGDFGKNKIENFSLGIHFSSNVECNDCHMYKESHTWEIESKACAECHTDRTIHTRRTILDLQEEALEDKDALEQLTAANLELESALSERSERSGIANMVTLGGAFVIATLAIIVVFSYLRVKNA